MGYCDYFDWIDPPMTKEGYSKSRRFKKVQGNVNFIRAATNEEESHGVDMDKGVADATSTRKNSCKILCVFCIIFLMGLIVGVCFRNRN